MEIGMRIHFIGIGGIGVSALAQYYLAKGHRVSGSDLVCSEITQILQNKGAEITIGKNVFKKDADLVIYSLAVNMHRRNKVHTLSYPQALGELTKKYFTIAVTGTHGKSTTTAMTGLVLTEAGLDPTVIVGTKVKEFDNTNFRLGKSKYLVIEADEHFGSFLNYWPKIIVLTNIERDHLDYYKNLDNIYTSFRKFIEHLPKDGVLIYRPQFSPDSQKLKKLLRIPGEHNVSNALAALMVARELGIPDKISLRALSEYGGSWRRFEEHNLKIRNCELKIISDYAHHPTEIKVTIQAIREKYPHRTVWAVFQPHQYQRTFYLFDQFTEALDGADRVVLTDIYDVAGREDQKIKKRVSSKKLAQAIKKRGKTVYYVADFKKIPDFLKKKVKPKDIILIMGAGDIYKVVNNFSP